MIDRNHYPYLFNLKLELKLIKPNSNGLFKPGLMLADVFNWVPFFSKITIWDCDFKDFFTNGTQLKIPSENKPDNMNRKFNASRPDPHKYTFLNKN